MIGVLAYGSLIADYSWEIERRRTGTIPEVWTPFPVEYARRSSTRGDAPTLVPVPPGCGSPVKAVILVMKKFSHKDAIQNYLYRREMHAVGDTTKVYNHEVQLHRRNAMQIETIPDFQGLEVVYCTVFPANFTEILDPGRTPQEKALLLAQAAIDSLTADTYPNGIDGIQYLITNSAVGVITPLTDLYKHAILRLADNETDLAETRLRIARQKGIIG